METVLRLHPALAPVKAAILPVSKKEPLTGIARKLQADLARRFYVQYDEVASIGRRYRRQDEIGTPFCLTVDFDTPNDNKVTVRDRDTMKQERVALGEVGDLIAAKVGA